MVRTRKGIYVGSQEVQRRYIGNKLIFENLVDMDDKVKVSGTEIFTDKADNSVVHVDVDGKSYQDGVPTPDYPIEIHSLNDFDVVSSTEKLSEGQLEEYDYDTEYENIYKINLLLSKPLRSVGDVHDRLFRDSDELWKVERKVGRVIFNENTALTWSVNSVGNVLCWIRANDKIYGSEYISTHYKWSGEIWSTITEINVMPENSNIAMPMIGAFVDSIEFPTISAYKGWLKNNNVSFFYQLLNPTIETLPQEIQDKLNNLRTFKDSNYVYTIINTDISPTLHATFKSKGWYDDYQDTLLK